MQKISGIIEMPSELELRRCGCPLPFISVEISESKFQRYALITTDKDFISMQCIGRKAVVTLGVTFTSKSMGLQVAEVRDIEYDHNGSLAPEVSSVLLSSPSSSLSRSVKGYIDSISCIQMLKGLGESAFIRVIAFRNEKTAAECHNIILIKSALTLIPFLQRGSHCLYEFYDLKRVKVKDDIFSWMSFELEYLTNATIRLVSCDQFRRGGTVYSSPSMIMKDYWKFSRPQSYTDLEKYSQYLYSVEGVVKCTSRSDWVWLEDVVNNRFDLLIITVHSGSRVASMSLRPGAHVVFHMIRPVYLWGKLIAFAADLQSYYDVVEFSTEALIDPSFYCHKKGLKEKCAAFVAWYALSCRIVSNTIDVRSSAQIQNIVNCIVQKFNFHDIDLTNNRSPLIEFLDMYYYSFYGVRAGLDIDYLSSMFPKICSLSDIMQLLKSSRSLSTGIDSDRLGKCKYVVRAVRSGGNRYVLAGEIQDIYYNESVTFFSVRDQQNRKILGFSKLSKSKVNKFSSGDVVTILQPKVFIEEISGLEEGSFPFIICDIEYFSFLSTNNEVSLIPFSSENSLEIGELIFQALRSYKTGQFPYMTVAALRARAPSVCTNSSNISSEDGNWKCSACLHLNFIREVCCYKCKRKRECLKLQELSQTGSTGQVLSVRDLLMVDKIGVIPTVFGIVIYKIGKEMPLQSHYKRQKTDSNCAIYLRDLNTSDFITVYMPESEVRAVFVGLILTLKNFVYSEASSKKYTYLKHKEGKSCIGIIGIVDAEKLEYLGQLQPTLSILLESPFEAPFVNLSGLLRQKENRCLWKTEIKFSSIDSVSVKMFCCKCQRFSGTMQRCPNCGCEKDLVPKWLWDLQIDDGTAKITAEIEDFDLKNILLLRKSAAFSSREYILSIEDRVKHIGEITSRPSSRELSVDEDIDPVEPLDMTSESLAKKILASYISSLSLNLSFSVIGRMRMLQSDLTSPIPSTISIQSRLAINNANNREGITQVFPAPLFRIIYAKRISAMQ